MRKESSADCCCLLVEQLLSPVFLFSVPPDIPNLIKFLKQQVIDEIIGLCELPRLSPFSFRPVTYVREATAIDRMNYNQLIFSSASTKFKS